MTGKIYVGETSNFKERINKHLQVSKRTSSKKYYFQSALAKYGIDAFEYFIIETFSNEAEALSAEKLYIRLFNSKVPNGYNLTDGGDGTSGYVHTEEHKQKNREAHLGEKSAWYGKKHSPESKKLMSQIRLDLGDKLYHGYSEKFSGERNNMAKLKDKDVEEMLSLWFSIKIEKRNEPGFQKNFCKNQIEPYYNCTYKNFNNILAGHIWKHIMSKYN